MSLFDTYVQQALQSAPELGSLRPVVEKELLHREILRVMSDAGDLAKLVFMGGTCLRACYGSPRLSEDLDFTAGPDFSKDILVSLGQDLVKTLQEKYGFAVQVSQPMREEGNTDTWKIRIQTRPAKKDMPAQRINIDVCAIRSYQVRPMLLLNPYGVDLGVSGLVVRAESREEIFVDKLIALALRPNRIKNRDLWDIAWLHQQSVQPAMELLAEKVAEHRVAYRTFLDRLGARIQSLKTEPSIARDFQQELSRFLPSGLATRTVQNPDFWPAVVQVAHDLQAEIKES